MNPRNWPTFTSSGKDKKSLPSEEDDDIRLPSWRLGRGMGSRQETMYVRKVRTLPLDVDMDGDRRCESGMEWEEEAHVDPALIEALNHMQADQADPRPLLWPTNKWRHDMAFLSGAFLAEYYKGTFWTHDQVIDKRRKDQ